MNYLDRASGIATSALRKQLELERRAFLRNRSLLLTLFAFGLINVILWMGQEFAYKDERVRMDEIGDALRRHQASLRDEETWLKSHRSFYQNYGDPAIYNQRIDSYEKGVSEYNQLVDEYNQLAKTAGSNWLLLPVPIPRASGKVLAKPR
ncbi:MAG: hypothetical protein ACREK3_01465 [Gemmatimonadota bacterium]